VDSVFESGHSHAGRLVTVFLKNAQSNVEAEAIERNLVVVWDGSNNKVTTSGLLGQSAGSASTDPADYTVVAQGVTVRLATAGLDSISPYAFIGTVTGGSAGNPPSGFSTTGQVDVTSGISPDLQAAYNLGRTINTAPAQGGAVRIQSTNSGDSFRAGLVINRMTSATNEDGSGALYLLQDEDTGVGIAILTPVHDGGTNLYEQEAVTTAASDVVNFTRGGVDVQAGGTNPLADFLLIDGTSSLDGLYLIDTQSSSTVTVQALGGGSPSGWAAGQSGNGTILRARMLGWAPPGGGFGNVSTWGHTVGYIGGIEFHSGPGAGQYAMSLHADNNVPAVRAETYSGADAVLNEFYSSGVKTMELTFRGLIPYDAGAKLGGTSNYWPDAYITNIHNGGYLETDDIRQITGAGTMTIGEATTGTVEINGEFVTLDVANDIALEADNDVNITADANSGGNGDVNISGQNVTVQAGNGSGDDIVLENAEDIELTASGEIRIAAPNDIKISNGAVRIQGGTVNDLLEINGTTVLDADGIHQHFQQDSTAAIVLTCPLYDTGAWNGSSSPGSGSYFQSNPTTIGNSIKFFMDNYPYEAEIRGAGFILQVYGDAQILLDRVSYLDGSLTAIGSNSTSGAAWSLVTVPLTPTTIVHNSYVLRATVNPTTNGGDVRVRPHARLTFRHTKGGSFV